MDVYKFTDEMSASIVKGIMRGYKSYLNERIQKKKELIISSAYAWVQGNHIDHYVAMETKNLGINYIPSKAGYSWGYLQFQNINDKVLFLIKNGAAIKRNVTKKRANREDNYLEQMARKFNGKINFSSKTTVSEQLDLFRLYDQIQVVPDLIESEIEELEDQIDRFYVVTYTLDEQKMISDISLCLPHPDTFKLHRIDSLTRFIDIIDIEFTDEDFAGIRDDKEIDTQITIGDYDIVVEDKDKASDTE